MKVLLKLLKLLGNKRDAEGRMGKDWWKSKTLVINGISAAIMIFSMVSPDIEITGDAEVLIFNILNSLLRLVTNSPTGFYDLKE